MGPYYPFEGAPLIHTRAKCIIHCDKNVCILLLVASMKITEFLNPTFIRSGIAHKDYYLRLSLSFKMIPSMTYFLKEKRKQTYFPSTKRINTDVNGSAAGENGTRSLLS